MVAAMKARDEARLGTVRMIKTALKKHEIDSMKPLDEATEMQVMSTLIKQRREAADLYRKGGREDLAVKEEAELKLIESYMPAEPTEGEMDAAVEAAVAETDGHGDESGPGEADRETRRRQNTQHKSESATRIVRDWTKKLESLRMRLIR
jgi:uncharacterized protein YqeY